ncbi:MAG: thioredoxin family protein, partial [Rhodospirillales bacterium]|nr:thioredoxin family protein [Rhodospirillales bacterium]
ADWCLTCQINKAFVLAKDDMLARLGADNVVAMQADWTLPNDDIADYLATFGRYGIPFNAVYGPGLPGGLALPELLTHDIVTEALDKAIGKQ